MGFGKDGKGVIIREANEITLGALASRAAVKNDAGLALTDDFRMLRSEIRWAIEGATQVDGDGPIALGIANDILSVAEIAACLNVDGPLGPNDRPTAELAERGVFLFGEPIAFKPTSAGDETEGVMELKQRWTYNNPAGWAFFGYNMGSGALTTGGIIRLNMIHYGVWVI